MLLFLAWGLFAVTAHAFVGQPKMVACPVFGQNLEFHISRNIQFSQLTNLKPVAPGRCSAEAKTPIPMNEENPQLILEVLGVGCVSRDDGSWEANGNKVSLLFSQGSTKSFLLEMESPIHRTAKVISDDDQAGFMWEQCLVTELF